MIVPESGFHVVANASTTECGAMSVNETVFVVNQLLNEPDPTLMSR